MIRITLLGTVSGIPSTDRNHPAVCIEYFSTSYHCLLFDCGENTQVQLMKSGISFMSIDKIFITHWHADHFAGLIPLIQTMNLEGREKDLFIFAPEAEKFVRKILELSYYKPRFGVIPINVDFEEKEVKKILEEKEFEIYSIPVDHTIPAVAYCFKEKDRINIDESKLKKLKLEKGRWLRKIKKIGYYKIDGKEIKLEDIAKINKGIKIVYTGDTRPCEQVVEISKDSDILIHDATFFEEDEADGIAHADFFQAIEIAKKSNSKFLILTHLSRRYRNLDELEEKAREVFPNCKVARDLMKIVIKKNEIEINGEKFVL